MSEEQETPQPANTEPKNFTPPPFNGGFNYGIQQALPNATAVLILGILSLITCCCYGIIGTILAIIALVLSKKDRILYATNVGMYTESSYKNLNAGRVCAIIGLILSALVLIFYIIIIISFGWAVLSDQNQLREALQNLQNA